MHRYILVLIYVHSNTLTHPLIPILIFTISVPGMFNSISEELISVPGEFIPFPEFKLCFRWVNFCFWWDNSIAGELISVSGDLNNVSGELIFIWGSYIIFQDFAYVHWYTALVKSH